jgi:DNA polymerase-3 subunit delta'
MTELLDIVGQDAAVGLLERALTGNREPHAYLFAGPAGVGRRTTGLALGRALLCEDIQTQPNAGHFKDLDADQPVRQACGACTSCRMIDAGTHPDFQMVYKELARYHDDSSVRSRKMQELGIPVIKSFLIDPANRGSARGRGKVFVVLESELMSPAAQNALLKTLEEPPPDVRIILICRWPDRMLPTTLSRCWMVRFGPLPLGFVRDKLIAAGVDASEAGFWAEFTEGSVGRALKLAGQDMYAIKRDVLDRLSALTAEGGAKLADHLAKLTDKLAVGAVADAKAADGSELAKTLASRQSAGMVLELIGSAYRDALTISTGTDRPLVHADQPEVPAALAGRFQAWELSDIIEQLAEYEQLLWRNVNPKTVWDNVGITCVSAAPLRL